MLIKTFTCPKDHSTQKIWFLGQNVCPVARAQTDTQTEGIFFSFNPSSRIGPKIGYLGLLSELNIQTDKHTYLNTHS